MFGLTVCFGGFFGHQLGAQILDISPTGSHARFVWDTQVTPEDTSINIPGNGNADLIFDQFNNDVQWGEAWFLQGNFGSGLQNIELTNGSVTNNGDQGTVDFINIENTGIDLSLNYLIFEDVDGLPFLNVTATVTNNSGAGFNGSLINYFDYHLGTLANDQGNALLGGNQIVTSDQLIPQEHVIRHNEVTDHWEIGNYDVSQQPFSGLYFDLTAQTNQKLTLLDTNTVPNNLDNITAAQQWNLNLGAGDSFVINGFVDHNMPASVPEPSALMLLAFTTLGFATCRRRRRK